MVYERHTGCLVSIKTNKEFHKGPSCKKSSWYRCLFEDYYPFIWGGVQNSPFPATLHEGLWGARTAAQWLPIFRQMFYAPMPTQPSVLMPAAQDLIIYFRVYWTRSFFDNFGGGFRLGSTPFAFYQWAVEYHRRIVSGPNLHKALCFFCQRVR